MEGAKKMINKIMNFFRKTEQKEKRLTYEEFIKKLRREEKQKEEENFKEEKDPMDWKFTPDNSTHWKRESYCTKCMAKCGFYEALDHYCDSCGTFYSTPYHYHMEKRYIRKIWHYGRWVIQYKYSEKEYELKDEYYYTACTE